MSLDDRLRESLHAVSVMDPPNLDDADASLRQRIHRHDARRRHLQAGVAAVAVVALVLGSVALFSRSSNQRNVIEPAPGTVKLSELNGWWVADVNGVADPVVIALQPIGHEGEASLWPSCGKVSGSYAATTDGRIIATPYSDRPGCFSGGQWPKQVAWLQFAATFSGDASGWQFLDTAGGLLASLRPATADDIPPEARSDWSDRVDLSPQQAATIDQPTTVPDGVTPATFDDLAGSWAAMYPQPTEAYISFASDGTFEGYDGGCERRAGRWTIGSGGEIATILYPPVGRQVLTCLSIGGADLASWFVDAGAIGVVDGGLQLYDANGRPAHTVSPGGGPTYDGAELTCRQESNVISDYGLDAKGATTPGSAVVPQLRPGESADFGQMPSGQIVALVRDREGSPVALIALLGGADGTWLVESVRRCADNPGR